MTSISKIYNKLIHSYSLIFNPVKSIVGQRILISIFLKKLKYNLFKGISYKIIDELLLYNMFY